MLQIPCYFRKSQVYISSKTNAFRMLGVYRSPRIISFNRPQHEELWNSYSGLVVHTRGMGQRQESSSCAILSLYQQTLNYFIGSCIFFYASVLTKSQVCLGKSNYRFSSFATACFSESGLTRVPLLLCSSHHTSQGLY